MIVDGQLYIGEFDYIDLMKEILEVDDKVYTELFKEAEEIIVKPEKKTDFQKLQGWVHSKRNLH